MSVHIKLVVHRIGVQLSGISLPIPRCKEMERSEKETTRNRPESSLRPVFVFEPATGKELIRMSSTR